MCDGCRELFPCFQQDGGSQCDIGPGATNAITGVCGAYVDSMEIIGLAETVFVHSAHELWNQSCIDGSDLTLILLWHFEEAQSIIDLMNSCVAKYPAVL